MSKLRHKSMQHIIVYASNEYGPDYFETHARTSSGKEVPLSQVGKASADYSLISYRLNYLIGRILTQVDASFTDPVQRKAFKDEIRQKFADEFHFFTDSLEKHVMNDALKNIEEMTDEELAAFLKENPPLEISEVIAKGQ